MVRRTSEIEEMLDDARFRFGESNVFYVPICKGFIIDLPGIRDAVLVDYEAEKICVEDLRATDVAYKMMRFYRKKGWDYELDFGI